MLVAELPNREKAASIGFWAQVEYLLRLGFFAAAPFAIVFVASLFPVRGAIVDVVVALGVFTIAEHARRWAARFRVLNWLFDEALKFESYYRIRSPRPFLYYLFYPFLFPHWLLKRDARREFLVFRGYNLGGLVILIATLVWQYYTRFPPELGWRDFLHQVWLTFLIELLLALSLLMPIATSYVWYHGRGQRRRLDVLLAVGLISSAAAIAQVAHRRDAIVSYAASERVTLRTMANRRKAHQTLVAAARAARTSLLETKQIEGDGKVMGGPLEAARSALKKYYKSDEVMAFDLWATPRKRPRTLVLYFEARRTRRPIWVAVDGYGREIRSPDRLPRGAFDAMRAASDGTETLLDEWPDAIDFDLLSPQ